MLALGRSVISPLLRVCARGASFGVMSSVSVVRSTYCGLAALVFSRDSTVTLGDRILLHLLFANKGVNGAARACRVGGKKQGLELAALLAAGLVCRRRHGQINLTPLGGQRCVEILSPWINALHQDARPVKSLF